jgi:DNA-binding response OmpR family regulator/cell fate (sporulation/competence/biofilm development) regulator YlbF (YheA/YmcA/DUF963 family)
MPKEGFDLSSTLGKMRVLAIDDMVEARTALKKMMATLGAKLIDICNDGEEASNYIRMNYYDLIISDYNLGKGKDGQQVLEEAKFSGRLRASSTFIMLTGESTPEMVMGALEYEPDDYITKPFTVDIVKKRLSRILQVKAILNPITNAIDKEDFELAIKECDLVLKKSPKLFFKILRLKTQMLMKLNRYDQALSCFELIIEQRELPWALLGKAKCLAHQNDTQAAKDILTGCLDQYPKYVQCLDELANISIAENKLDDAQTFLQKGVYLSPKAMLRQSELGKVAYTNQDFSIAEVALKQAIKLSKNSYHKDPEIMLMFVKSMQKKINSSNSKESASKSQELFKVIGEGKDSYNNDEKFQLEATIVESNTYVSLGKKKEALMKSQEAEKLFKSSSNLPVDLQLSMAENFINTGQSLKSEEIINKLEELGLLDEDTSHKAKGLRQNLSLEEAERYSTEINDKAIKCYEQGNLSQAIHLFNQAVAYKEAGASVLLNAIQAKIAYMEAKEIDPNMIAECKELFKRLGNIAESDERFDRYKKLRDSFEKISGDKP